MQNDLEYCSQKESSLHNPLPVHVTWKFEFMRTHRELDYDIWKSQIVAG